jgi:hypothetical protein
MSTAFLLLIILVVDGILQHNFAFGSKNSFNHLFTNGINYTLNEVNNGTNRYQHYEQKQ